MAKENSPTEVQVGPLVPGLAGGGQTPTDDEPFTVHVQAAHCAVDIVCEKEQRWAGESPLLIHKGALEAFRIDEERAASHPAPTALLDLELNFKAYCSSSKSPRNACV